MDVEAHGLVAEVDGEQRLVGAACADCATHVFPPQANCPRCGGVMRSAVLAATGTVWSWTVQRIRPKPPYEGPADHEPFVVGYVDLGPLRVEARLDGRSVDGWQIGDAVALAAGARDDDGAIWSYRFRPAPGEDRSP